MIAFIGDVADVERMMERRWQGVNLGEDLRA
jgi:hypothetical protein